MPDPHESKDSIAPAMGSLDGGDPAPMPVPGGVAEPPPPPLPFTAEHVPCLRDCRYYFATAGHFDAHNPGSRFVQLTHACMRIPGVYLEMSADAPDYECNAWDPFEQGELRPLERRRAAWFARNPEVPNRPLEERIKDGLEVDVVDDDEGGDDDK